MSDLQFILKQESQSGVYAGAPFWLNEDTTRYKEPIKEDQCQNTKTYQAKKQSYYKTEW